MKQREIDRVAALELGLPGLGLLRRLRADVRRGVGGVLGYLDETGSAIAWTGDEEAPYVKEVPISPRVVNLNPSAGAAVPLYQVLEGRGRVVEVWAIDLRDQSLSPATIYLQIFDQLAEPQAGDLPAVTALPLCQVAAYEWASTAQLFENGLWVGLSSTALSYTPLVASQEFAITTRVLP